MEPESQSTQQMADRTELRAMAVEIDRETAYPEDLSASWGWNCADEVERAKEQRTRLVWDRGGIFGRMILVDFRTPETRCAHIESILEPWCDDELARSIAREIDIEIQHQNLDRARVVTASQTEKLATFHVIPSSRAQAQAA